jgi:hypothetical protein
LLRIGLIGGGLALLAVLPVETIERFPAFCPSRVLLDHDCPGCGMSRALGALLKGEVQRALAFNRLVVPVLLALLAWLAWDTARLWRLRPGRNRRASAAHKSSGVNLSLRV